MAKTKKENFKELNIEQLAARLTDLEAQHQKNRFAKVTGELTQTHRLRAVRRDIARVKTLIRAHRIAQAKKG